MNNLIRIFVATLVSSNLLGCAKFLSKNEGTSASAESLVEKGLKVSLTSPNNNSTLTIGASVALSASTSTGKNVARVEFYVNSGLYCTDTTSPFSCNYTAASAGTYLIQAKAYTTSGQTSNSGINTLVIQTAPPPPDTVPPTISLATPVSGITVSGLVAISANAFDNVGVAGVQFLLDGVALQVEDLSAPYSINLDTTSLSNGAHALAAKARDAAGNVATTANISIAVANAVTIPSYCSSGGSLLWNNLASCGWPNASTAGVPTGIGLRSTVGRRITVDGSIIEGEKITGGIYIAAKNVIVRNSWIVSSFGTGEAVNGTGVINVEPGASVTIEHCTLDGSNLTHAGIWYEGINLVARGNNILGVNDGIFNWDADNFLIEDNYLHGFTTATANGHIDGFQTEGSSHGTIRHNVFDITQEQNAALGIWNGRRTSTDILVDNNLMTGGGFTVYVEDYNPSEASPGGGYSVTNIRIQNNKFSTIHFPCVGQWGVWYTRGAPTDAWNRTGNTVLETGQNIDTQNPTIGGIECR